MAKYQDAQRHDNVRLEQICPVCSKSKNRGTFTWLFFAKDRCECKLANNDECKLVEVPSPSIEPSNSEESQSLSEKPNVDLGTRYEVIKELGGGAAGAVYQVYDRELKKNLAVKVLRDEVAADEGVLARFKQEADLAVTLSHENLVAMYGLSTSPKGNPFIVMDLLDGRSLETVLNEDGPLSEERFVSIFTQILEGLSHAHMKGLIHRDLKPSNIMIIESSPGVEIVKLIDFGIAKLTETSLRTTHNLTETGEVFGTPIYMSPEQCLGFAVDARADIYSLGCVMYECATGSPPFSGKNAIQIISKHLSQEPADLATIDDRLGELINSCLAKEPGDRPKSAREILLSLQKIKLGEQGLSVSFNPSAVKQLVRSKASNVIPSMRLAYGALGLSMWCGFAMCIFFQWHMMNTHHTPSAIAMSLEIFAAALFTFQFLLSQAARAYIRECSAEIESVLPAQDKLECAESKKIGTTTLQFQGEPQAELFFGETIRSATGGVQNTCAVWRDEHDNRIAADFGNTTLMKWDALAIVKKVNLWFALLFAADILPWILPPWGSLIWVALLLLLASRLLYRSMRQGDRLLLPLCGLSIPMVLANLSSLTYYYLLHLVLPAAAALWISRISYYYFFFLAFSWLAYGTLRLLEKKGVIRIRNKYLKSVNLKPDNMNVRLALPSSTWGLGTDGTKTSGKLLGKAEEPTG